MVQRKFEFQLGTFLDIGNGLFFALDEDLATNLGDAPIGYVADSLAPDRHDIQFGPAAWNGAKGPLSGLTLLTVGEYPGWNGEHYQINRNPFPGKVSVTTAGIRAGLAPLERRHFEKLGDLVAELKCFGQRSDLPLADSAERSPSRTGDH